MEALGVNGVFIFTGVPGRKGPIEIDTDLIMRNLVLKNQLVYGTVNAGRDAFEAAVADLAEFQRRWPEPLGGLITGRHPPEDCAELLLGPRTGIKPVVSSTTRDEPPAGSGPEDPERQRLDRGRRARGELEALGAVPRRAPVGHRARGLLGGRRVLDLSAARSRPQPRLSLGRGRPARVSPIASAALCFAIALWNGKDPILKERLFGLTGPEGNHGEDVKELYYYLDATPTSRT